MITMADQKASDNEKLKRSDTSAPISKQIIRKRYRTPISMYHLKDKAMNVTTNPNFLDAVLLLLALSAALFTYGFWPLSIIILIGILLFVCTLYNSFLGLIIFTLAAFLIFIYQVPVLAWFLLPIVTIILIYGFQHYRLMIFTYLLVALAFSPFGYILEIPVFIFAVLTIGNKRSILMAVVAILMIVIISGVTGLQNTGYIIYNAQAMHSTITNTQILNLDASPKPGFTLGTFGPGLKTAFGTFFSGPVTSEVSTLFGIASQSLITNPFGYILQIIALSAVIVVIDWYAVNSRSKYKGAISSLFGVAYPLSYIAISTEVSSALSILLLMPMVSFILAPAFIYIMEFYEVNIVRALDVRKQDIRMKFGEAFEDLAGGNNNETFKDIGNYEATKKELKEAIIAPIEERGISQAYNIKPSRGVLLFGPPGSGKTMMMRALANEIHAGFYYVKANNLVSAYPGESERLISNLFSIAKKNAPCVLFFDEIDSIALSRESPGVDDTHRHALSQLLVELDGFQKISNVIVVGATNVPNVMDPAILRPGRFDRLIYMPLPSAVGRKKIFDVYLSKLPVSKDIDTTKLANKTERYSGADIKSVCESVAQLVAQEAANEHKVLEISEQDILNVIKASKPSTGLSQLENYKKFKIDFERSTFSESTDESTKDTILSEVVGMNEAKKAIRDAIQTPLLHPELIKKYDVRTIHGLLLFGPPGTGKTMLMRAITNEMSGVTMLELNGADITQEGIERATATIKETFNRAKENTPSVIFIDEIDGLAPKREGASEISVQITSEVLKELDGIKQMADVIVIAATNRPDQMDPAILRPGRFDKLIFVKPPGTSNRVEMFKMFLKNVPLASDVDSDKLAEETKGFTGADIANICREAKTDAMNDELKSGKEGKLSMEIIDAVIKRVKPSAPESVIDQYQSFLSKYGQR